MSGLETAASGITALAGSMLVLEIGQLRVTKATYYYEQALTSLQRAQEGILDVNQSLGENTDSVAVAQADLATILPLVTQAHLEVGAATKVEREALAQYGPYSAEAASAQEQLTMAQMKWQEVLKVGDPIVSASEAGINKLSDAQNNASFRTEVLKDSQMALRASNLLVIGSAAQVVAAVAKTIIAYEAQAIAGAEATAFTPVVGAALVAAAIAAGILAVAYIEGAIPGTASGGIFSRPQVRLIAERGPEAVVPLGGAGFGGREEIHVHLELDGAEIEKAIIRRNR